MFLVSEETTQKIITQEGGEIDKYVLDKYGPNVNDPTMKSTKCRTKRGIIDYKTAKKRFDEYYDNLNRTASGRMRGKMFDIKYNKKTDKILYPGEPCSERYLEPNGPAKYDMWGVDAFPEGTTVQVTDTVSVTTKKYDKNIPKDKRYGSTLTNEYIVNNLNPEEYINEKAGNRLFNTHFKEKDKNWEENRPKPKKIKRNKPISDIDDKEFQEALEHRRNKRDIKKRKQAERESKRVAKVVDIVEEQPDDGKLVAFIQPKNSQKVPEESLITTLDQYKELTLDRVFDSDIATLISDDNMYYYKVPLNMNFLSKITLDDLEIYWNKHIDEIFNLLKKPIKPFAHYTEEGIRTF